MLNSTFKRLFKHSVNLNQTLQLGVLRLLAVIRCLMFKCSGRPLGRSRTVRARARLGCYIGDITVPGIQPPKLGTSSHQHFFCCVSTRTFWAIVVVKSIEKCFLCVRHETIERFWWLLITSTIFCAVKPSNSTSRIPSAVHHTIYVGWAYLATIVLTNQQPQTSSTHLLEVGCATLPHFLCAPNAQPIRV